MTTMRITPYARPGNPVMSNRVDTFICRKCKMAILSKNPKLCSCHFCHTYYCSKKCRADDFEKHKSKCVGCQISSFSKFILKTITSTSDFELIEKICKVGYDGFCKQGRGAVILQIDDLAVIENMTDVRSLVTNYMEYIPKAKLPMDAKKTRKAVVGSDPNEKVVLSIYFDVKIGEIEMSEKEKQRNYRFDIVIEATTTIELVIKYIKKITDCQKKIVVLREKEVLKFPPLLRLSPFLLGE